MNNPSAFPDPYQLQLLQQSYFAHEKRAEIYLESRGMTLRDYFAAKAVSGMVKDWAPPFILKDMAEWAYMLADAMLEARERKHE